METEEKARTMGWVPKEEFRGSEERWVDAETFVDRGDNIMPILKERMGKFEDKIDVLIKSDQHKDQTIKNLIKLQKTTSERAYKKATRELQKEQRDAVAAGDTSTFDRVAADLKELEQEQNGTGDNGTGEVSVETSDDFKSWNRENMWYLNDQDLTAYANGVGPEIAKEHPGIDEVTFLNLVKEKVKTTFPEKFKNKKRDLPPSVEGDTGQDNTPNKGKAKTYRDLPADAKAACDQFVKDGLMKKEEYISEYFGEE